MELPRPPAPPLSKAEPPAPRTRNLPRDPSKEKVEGTIALPKSNIGYKLLVKAGWSGQGGLGLGARQGRIEPIQAEMRQGNVGLGFEEPKKKIKISRKNKLIIDSKEGEKDQGGNADSKSISRKFSTTLPRDELAGEDIQTKVKRVRQVMQAEADEKAGKELARLVYSAFREDGHHGGSSTTDINPLLRKNRKISARNPLL